MSLRSQQQASALGTVSSASPKQEWCSHPNKARLELNSPAFSNFFMIPFLFCLQLPIFLKCLAQNTYENWVAHQGSFLKQVLIHWLPSGCFAFWRRLGTSSMVWLNSSEKSYENKRSLMPPALLLGAWSCATPVYFLSSLRDKCPKTMCFPFCTILELPCL